MTLIIEGGPALPVTTVTDGRATEAYVAYPVHTFSGATDGRPILAMPVAQAVTYLQASDLAENGGPYHLAALPAAHAVITGLGLPAAGGRAIAVYEVSDPYPAPLVVVTPPVPPPAFPPITAGLILNLQADALALVDGDPVSLWADASGQEHDFTQSGSARPTYHSGDGHPYLGFDGIDDSMLGPDFADNLSSFTVFSVHNFGATIITKMNNEASGAGWAVYHGAESFIIQESGGASWILTDTAFHEWPPRAVCSSEMLSKTTLNIYINGDNSHQIDSSNPPVNDFSTSEPVRLATFGNGSLKGSLSLSAVMLYTPALSSADRATMETALATKYGIVLP